MLTKSYAIKKCSSFSTYIILLSFLSICSCDGLQGSQPSNYKAFNDDLQGRWSSNDPGLYSGTLHIDSDSITIGGYGEGQTPLNGDDSKRPFKDFPKGVSLEGYSEEGEIFICYGESAQNGIPYVYTEVGSYPQMYRLLEFTFGGRKEIVQGSCSETEVFSNSFY
jgi:hypothetical protein